MTHRRLRPGGVPGLASFFPATGGLNGITGSSAVLAVLLPSTMAAQNTFSCPYRIAPEAWANPSGVLLRGALRPPAGAAGHMGGEASNSQTLPALQRWAIASKSAVGCPQAPEADNDNDGR